MAIDFENLCLAPVYDTFAQSVSFASPATGENITLPVLDGATAEQVGSFVQMDTNRPAIRVRSSDLDALAIDPADMIGVELSWRDRTFTVRTTVKYPLDGAPGEILFILAEA